MRFTAVVVTHANPSGLRRMLENLRTQTRPPDEVIVVCTQTDVGRVDYRRAELGFDRFVVASIAEVGDWGHAKRDVGLRLATGDWVGFFNDDDSYDPAYLERMLDKATELDVEAVWCSWNENPGGDFRKFEATAGNFIVRTPLAQEIGWTGRHYEADGDFIDAIVASPGARTAKVGELLYHHNV